MADVNLDCKGLNCPMPIVKVGKTMKKLSSGQTVEVVADDPAFEADIRAWVRRMGHELSSFEDGDVKTALIVKV